MKKVLSFFRSMKFGMVLLLLIIACSFAGSLIPQQRQAMEYVTRYGDSGASIIMALGFDNVFSTPYFIILMAALCLNLTLCSLVRFPSTKRAGKKLVERAQSGEADQELSETAVQKTTAYLKSKRFHEVNDGDNSIYIRNMFGFYGSFMTHLSILLILCFGTAAVVFADVTDETVMPGSTLTLSDGTKITVEAFQIEDETGRLDYASTLVATSADESQSTRKVVRVNEPLTFGAYKIYQQTYGTAGSVLIHNHQNNASETMALTESCFLTLNGTDGVLFQALYPGYVQDENGSITLITSTSGVYTDPVYDILSVSGGAMTPVLAFPGETLTIGDVSYTFQAPVSYPGLRIKHMSSILLTLLYISFGLMVIGLYLCFFNVPVAIKLTKSGMGVYSPKAQTGLMLELEAIQKEET